MDDGTDPRTETGPGKFLPSNEQDERRPNLGRSAAGDRVLVREGNGHDFQAHVDESTADSTIIRAIPTDVRCRRIFHITNDVKIIVLPPLKPEPQTA
jgi:hypothetical protein